MLQRKKKHTENGQRENLILFNPRNQLIHDFVAEILHVQPIVSESVNSFESKIAGELLISQLKEK